MAKSSFEGVAVSKKNEGDEERIFDRAFPQRQTSNIPVIENFTTTINDIILSDNLDKFEYYQYLNLTDELKKLLLKVEKGNIAIIGEEGVGKFTLLKSLTIELNKLKVPNKLKNLKFKILHLDDLISGAKYRGQLEERIKFLISELEHNPDIILCLRSFEIIINRTDETSSIVLYSLSKIANINKSKLIILITTQEMEKIVQINHSFFKNFSFLKMNPPNEIDTFEILRKKLPILEKRYNCIISEENLKELIHLSEIYIENQIQPVKSIDLLEDIFGNIEIFRNNNPNEEIQKKLDEAIIIEKSLELLKNERNIIVRSQRYEEAAQLREKEKEILLQLEKIKKEFDSLNIHSRYEVNIDDIETTLAKKTEIEIDLIKNRERLKYKSTISYNNFENNLSQYEITQTQSLLNNFEINIKIGKCFVLIPHNDEFDSIFNHCIKPTLEEFGISVIRASDIAQPGNILSQIWEHIRTSEIIIADLSSNNTNVIFELGLCYGIKRCPILLTNDLASIPFNLRTLRHIEYENNAKGINKLKETLALMVNDFISVTRKSVL